MKTKICTRCKTRKYLKYFYFTKYYHNPSIKIPQSMCMICSRIQSKKYRKPRNKYNPLRPSKFIWQKCKICSKKFCRALSTIRSTRKLCKRGSRFCSRKCSGIGRRKEQLTSNGYRRIWKDGKGRLEHRVIMESFLKRKLDSNEHVHHKNGIKTDNKLSNLQVFLNTEHGGGTRHIKCPNCNLKIRLH